MILSYNELLRLLEKGIVTNCPLSFVNGASIDLSISEKILVEHADGLLRPTDYRAREPLNMTEVIMDAEKGYVLRPGEFILASSQQLFNLPDDLACEFKLKSSAARVGINQLTACWCDPTWHGSALTLEIQNVSRYHHIRIRPEDRLGQMVFMRCQPVPEEASYRQRGRYNQDPTVSGIKP